MCFWKEKEKERGKDDGCVLEIKVEGQVKGAVSLMPPSEKEE